MNDSSVKLNIRRRCQDGVAIAIAAATALAVPVSGSFGARAQAQTLSAEEHKADVSFLEIDKDITLRRMVVHNANPKGTVLFLHGFPETLYAWKNIALTLAGDYEVHAFDWPGFGLSSRPEVTRFSYAPRDYARVLYDYIRKAGIDTSKLTIYATDIGALPALLLAQEEPGIATSIIVSDFAPFDRPQYMYESLQSLKAGPSMDQARDHLNRNRDDILENVFRRGLPREAQFDVPREFQDDMLRAWSHGTITTADAFSHYYANFTRDQNYFESNLGRLEISVKVVWGEKDLYIKKEMGIELADKIGAELTLLPGIGHYPHLQNPKQTIDEVRAAFR
ncbi:alpha/beta fold hydrolase [Tardiphaga robiniae]|uniref:Alpha/beta hydrolase n=1 Tax=Tardiphaga robiniae TaxID=943830 RepID=A0A7G6U3Q5_9BRAD|nr:alpha/beta hydrolase [Tardiphaga robiniae]QND73637.1 alpha/beta hydrolase [Tardiphaga robiniae]